MAAILVGTSRGLYRVSEEVTHKVADDRTVREIVPHCDLLFAGTRSGLIQSADQGMTWTSAGIEDKQVWQIRCSGTTLYASTQPAGLYRSDDDGASWYELDAFSSAPEAAEWCIPVDPPLPASARALVVDPDDADRIWVGVEVGGIMHSTDGGESWSLNLPGDNPDLHMMFAHPENPDVLLASTGYGRLDGVAEMVEGNAGVFRSEDAGQSWTYAWKGITPRYSRPMCIDSHAPYAVTVASAPTAFSSHKESNGAGAMIYRSDDLGENWRSLCDEAHTPSRANFHVVVPDAGIPGGVMTGTDTGEVWRVSNDADWSLVTRGLPTVLSIAAI